MWELMSEALIAKGGVGLQRFCDTFVPNFYRLTHEGADPPPVTPEEEVVDILDKYSAEEFFDHLSAALGGREAPRVSFSLAKTFADLYDLLCHIVGDDFRQHMENLGSSSSVEEKASSSAKVVVMADEDDDMPALEMAQKVKVVPPSSQEKKAPAPQEPEDATSRWEKFEKETQEKQQASSSAVAAPANNLSVDQMRGRAIYLLSTKSSCTSIEEITRVVLQSWSEPILQAFLAQHIDESNKSSATK